MYQWMERGQLRTKVYRYPLISKNVLAYTFVACKETQRFPQTSAQLEISCISGEFHILERRKINVYELKRVGLASQTGNFLPGGAVILLPKKFLQVAQIFTKQSKGNQGHATKQAVLAYESGSIQFFRVNTCQV